jgi:hypothetical protein
MYKITSIIIGPKRPKTIYAQFSIVLKAKNSLSISLNCLKTRQLCDVSANPEKLSAKGQTVTDKIKRQGNCNKYSMFDYLVYT